MERSDTRPPWARFSAASSVLRSGALISDRAWLRSRVRVSGLIVTSSDFGTTLRQTIVCSPRTLSTPVPPLATDRLDQLRQDLRDVVHDTIVGRLEDGGFRVRVDGDHRLGVLYANGELHGAADPAYDSQFRPRDVPRLADHRFAVHPALVHSHPAGAHFGVDEGGQLAQGIEVAMDPPAAYDQPLGARDVAPPRRRVPEHPHGRVVLGHTDIEALDARLAPLVARGAGEDAGANGGHLGPVPWAHYACQDAAAEPGHLAHEEAVPVQAEVCAVGGEAGAQAHRQPPRHLAAVDGRPKQEDVRLAVQDDPRHPR